MQQALEVVAWLKSKIHPQKKLYSVVNTIFKNTMKEDINAIPKIQRSKKRSNNVLSYCNVKEISV